MNRCIECKMPCQEILDEPGAKILLCCLCWNFKYQDKQINECHICDDRMQNNLEGEFS